LLYEVDSEETVTWLRSTKGQQAFAAKFGTKVSLASKPFPVITEYIPVRLAIDDTNTLREMERENDLLVNTIHSIRWIKPLERRAPNQCTAHMIINFFRPVEANLAIKNGLLMLGKRCSSQKLLLELTRCMKCQSFSGHYAKECKSLQDMCGTCTREHRTKDCTVTTPDKRHCMNC
ncbi:hypothetical protein SCLCIDRAFT_46563, partial [Scleroderma citrinum Foug A]